MADSTITFDPREVATYYATRIPHLKQRPTAQWRGVCPIHHGKDDNFAVNAATGRWRCHSTCGRGGSLFDLEMELFDVNFRTARLEVFRLVGRGQ